MCLFSDQIREMFSWKVVLRLLLELNSYEPFFDNLMSVVISKKVVFYSSHTILEDIALLTEVLKCLVLFHLFRLNLGGASSRCFVYLFPNYMYEISEFMRSQVK